MSTRRHLQTALFSLCLVLAPLPLYAAKVDEKPTAGEMAQDLLIARPVGIVVLALGSVAFVATLPFSLAGGNMKEAGDTLVVQPAKEAFVRCLGCTTSGYKESVK